MPKVAAAWIVLVSIAAAFILALAARLVAEAALRHGRLVTNYRDRQVPMGLGWVWVAVGTLGVAGNMAVAAWTKFPFARADMAPAALVLAAAFLGWVDDRFGSSAARGLRGHLRSLAEGRITTGLLKLVGIVVCSLAAAWFVPARSASPGARSYAAWLAAAVLIAGTTNLVNLLDLRPGRALKAYVLLCVLASCVMLVRVPSWDTLAASTAVVAALPLFLAPAFAVLPLDLSERGMLGDMGANAAGALAGWLLAFALPLPGLLAAAAILVALNLASERVSFSAVIERSGPLRWLDMLGRTAEDDGHATEAEPGETGDG